MAQSVLEPAWGDANAANGKSMADNSKLRVPCEPYRRAAEPADDSSYGSDPLTELARLIGKNDPYAEFGRGGSRDDERQDAYARSGRARDDAQPSLAREHYDERYDERPEPAAGRRPDAYGSGRESYALNADLPLTPRVSDWRSDHAPSYDAEPHFGRDHESEPYGDDDALQARTEQHENDGNSDLVAAADNQEEQSYDDPPRANRHGGLATALALIGCAILGTAGAYAYRSYFGQPGVAQPPPVITADTATPAKIVPPTAGDAQSGKTIQDRVANASREQVVSKQEEPVALKDLGTQGAPRVVLPTPVTPTPGPAAAPSAPLLPRAPRQNRARSGLSLSALMGAIRAAGRQRALRLLRPALRRHRAQLRPRRRVPVGRCRLIRRPKTQARHQPRGRERLAHRCDPKVQRDRPAAFWCNSRRTRRRRTRPRRSAVCRPNFRTSLRAGR